ncbi:rRNA processing protein, variant 2 [Clonorchis sinensis]|uniref:isopentenyl-diphosphate Delta-isomerase n=1 Tax=Clonorchis sinensis TaxID=79923 RepID=A0A8T1MV40_CLOSI|nr:rRNA processing protein, variant 2 [Clonorchis sinensis]
MRSLRKRLLSILNALRKFTESAAPGDRSKHFYEIQEHYMSTESCLKVDESDKVLGYASKKDCHEVINGAIPPLHRAFSLFLFRKLQPCLRASPLQLLIQRRAASKFTYPNLWSNTCCSHPIVNLPSELVEENALGVRLAAQRKIEHELGMRSDSVVPLSSLHFLTRFIYSAPNEPSDNSQWAEHEMDYILVSILDPKIVAAFATVVPYTTKPSDCVYL